MASVGIPATESGRGVGRVATAAEVAAGVTGANGPAFVTPERLPKQKSSPLESALLGSPFFLTSTTLPAGFMWADGSLALFADWPELHAKYASNGFAGMVLPYNASSYDKQNYPAKFVPNAVSPTGLYLPRLGGLFLRHWTPGSGTAGQYNAPGVPNIYGQFGANRMGLYEVGNNQCTGPFLRYANTLTDGQLGAGLEVSFLANYFTFNASYSSSLYGASSTVMPPSANVPVAVYLGVHA